MPELVTPTVDLYTSWCDARAEFGDDRQLHGTGFNPTVDVSSVDGFAAWLDDLRAREDESTHLAPGMVHCTYRWLVEEDTYLGAIALRHRLNDFLARVGGHIGYSVRPSARRRGLASWALGQMLDVARQRGIDRVLITCDDTNLASAGSAERNGGVLESRVDSVEHGVIRRYWIDLTSA